MLLGLFLCLGIRISFGGSSVLNMSYVEGDSPAILPVAVDISNGFSDYVQRFAEGLITCYDVSRIT